MTNLEKQELSREKFLKGQEIHRQREIVREFHKKRYEETKYWNTNIYSCDSPFIFHNQFLLLLMKGI